MKRLFVWAGGEEAIRRLIDAFYDRVERDELLSPFFPGGVREEHRAHVAAWWCEVFGGPARYSEELGGYENMLAHHRGLGITPEQRFRFASLLSLAADDAALPDDPEFRSAFVAYAEWGTRIALHNSQPGALVVAHAPVPRWGWGERRRSEAETTEKSNRHASAPLELPRLNRRAVAVELLRHPVFRLIPLVNGGRETDTAT